MTRPIGKNIVDVCQYLAAFGPCDSATIAKEIPDMLAVEARQYCLRALGHGFLTATSTSPPMYNVVENWRKLVEFAKMPTRPQAPRKKPVPAKQRTLAVILTAPTPKVHVRNSVFDVRV